MHNKNRDLILGIIIVLLLAIISLVSIDLADTSRAQIEIYGQVPDFTLGRSNRLMGP